MPRVIQSSEVPSYNPVGSNLNRFVGGKGIESKRPSVKKVLEFYGIVRMEQLRGLTGAEIATIKTDIDYFKKHPEIPAEQAAEYFRQRGEISFSIADRLSDKGRDALSEIRKELPETQVQ